MSRPRPRAFAAFGMGTLLGVVVAACVVAPVAVAATAGYTVLRDDDGALELVLEAPEPQRVEDTWEVPGFEGVGEPGLPVRYTRGLRFYVPGPRGARLEILDADRERLAPARIPRVPRRVPRHRRRSAAGDEALATLEPAPTRPMPPVYPAAVAEVSPPTRWRSRHVASLTFTPLQWHADGSVTYTRRLRVRLVWNDRPRKRTAAAPVTGRGLGGLVNAATAAGWAPTPVTSTRRRKPEVLPARRLRIRIATTGLYQLTYDRLRAAGVPVDVPSLFDPSTVQLFFDTWGPLPLFADSTPASWEPDYTLQEAAILVEGEADGVFDPQDRVLFHALGPSDYADRAGFAADSLDHRHHPYDRWRYAWLVWGAAPGLRMNRVAAAAPDPLSDPLVTTVRRREHFEENRLFREVDDLWIWDEVSRTRPGLASFSLDLGGAVAAPGTLYVTVGASEPGQFHAFEVRLNNDPPPPRTVWRQPRTPDAVGTFAYAVTLQSTNDLRVFANEDPVAVNDSVDTIPDGDTQILHLDVFWDRPLAAIAGRLDWERTPATSQEVYELRGFGASQPVVVDATDPLRPVRLEQATAVGQGSTTRWRYRYGRGAGATVRLWAAASPILPALSDLELRDVPDLRGVASAPQMVIVTHPSLRAEAERLAAHRRTHFRGNGTLDVQVVDTDAIYDNFSGGRMDPMAIRNYVKFLYGLDPQPRLEYVLLFGEATHDPLQLLPGTTPTLVPTVHFRYAERRFRRDFMDYAVDDWIVEMDRPAFTVPGVFGRPFPVPDLAIGRLTPRSVVAARRMVDRIIGYDLSTDYGAWRTRVILSADDNCTPRRCGESFHIGNMENLVDLTPAEWDLDKIYLTEFPSVLGQKPAARAAFIRDWSTGAALVTYQGHGAPRQIADEVLFLASDVPALTNGLRLPAFMAFSCTVSEFDDPELDAMAEDLVASARGGALVTMGATTPTFATPNARYNEEVWRALFADGATSRVPLGVVALLAKGRSPSSSGINNETYTLLGDPAQTLQTPERIIEFPVGADSLRSGEKARVEGIVRWPDSTAADAAFAGTVDVEVFSSADESGFTSTDPRDAPLHINYDLLGAPLYRGTVQAVAGRFAFEFFVPLGARLGGKGRISAYAYSASGIDAKGAEDRVRIGVSSNPVTSQGPPQIRLSFPNNLTKVKAGTPLLAELADDNGINIQGGGLRSGILLDFDRNNQPLDVTERFRYEAGSATFGTVSVPLPDNLGPGSHSATLIASDNLQNTSTATIEFEVVEAGVSRLVNVIAFPNPFKDRTYFFFEITDPADVEVNVFTTGGRRVWRAERHYDAATQGSIRWEGVDLARDALANGTYLYTLEARPTRRGAPRLRYTGKVVIMRD